MSEKFEQWCVVELFGHSRIAGYVTEQTIGGQSFVRVDVPATKLQQPFTRLFGSGAIYAINPVAEDVARGVAETIQAKPIQSWDLPEDYREAIKEHQQAKRLGVAAGAGDPQEPDFGSDEEDDDEPLPL